MEIQALPRRWGSSIAVIIPNEIVKQRNIRENVPICIEIKGPAKVADLFGKFPRFSGKSAQEIKDEMRKGWD